MGLVMFCLGGCIHQFRFLMVHISMISRCHQSITLWGCRLTSTSVKLLSPHLQLSVPKSYLDPTDFNMKLFSIKLACIPLASITYLYPTYFYSIQLICNNPTLPNLALSNPFAWRAWSFVLLCAPLDWIPQAASIDIWLNLFIWMMINGPMDILRIICNVIYIYLENGIIMLSHTPDLRP